MKSADKIKKGLECNDCNSCPYSERNTPDRTNHCWDAEIDALALIQQPQAENTELRENIMWMEAERDDFKRTIRQLKAERDTAVMALTVTRDKVEQAHNMLIDDIVHRVDDDTYLVLSNMVGNMLDWPVEDDEHSTQQEEDQCMNTV